METATSIKAKSKTKAAAIPAMMPVWDNPLLLVEDSVFKSAGEINTHVFKSITTVCRKLLFVTHHCLSLKSDHLKEMSEFSFPVLLHNCTIIMINKVKILFIFWKILPPLQPLCSGVRGVMSSASGAVEEAVKSLK